MPTLNIARDKPQAFAEILRMQLVNERQSFLAHWRDLGNFILPMRPRFTLSETNKGDRRNQKIIDNTSVIAIRTLRSGMMGGITSPARPWFRLTLDDDTLAETPNVARWLNETTEKMQAVFLRSNLYQALPSVYGDLGAFATGCMLVEEDFTGRVVHFTPIPIGMYALGNDEKGNVRVFYRELRLTVRQMFEEFEPQNISEFIHDQRRSGHTEAWVDIHHIIFPNPDFDANALEGRFKRFRSMYYEQGRTSTAPNRTAPAEKLLRDSGFDMFPVLAPRWQRTGGDVYGTSCPGIEALGDIKQLQLGERRSAQAIEKVVNPPMTGPASLKRVKASLLPGDITFDDVREGQKGFRPVFQIDPRINELEGKQEQIRQRIERAFFADLFLMLALDRRAQPPTAEEVKERQEEKLLALGPVLEQLNNDLLDPLIDITFDFMLRQGLIPEPPPELEPGAPLKVEFVSIMAQAQKLVGLASIERFTNFVGQVAAIDPRAWDKMNVDRLIELYGDSVGVEPEIIASDEEAFGKRKQREEAARAQAQLEAVREGSAAAKDLASAKLEEDSPLRRILAQARAGQIEESA